MYAYCDNNPIANIDPSGYLRIKITWTLTKVIDFEIYAIADTANFWIDIVNTTTWDLTYVQDHQSEIYYSQYEIGDVVMFLNNNDTPGHAMIIVGYENGDFL